MLNDDEIFLLQMSECGNDKCAVGRELLKKAKLLKYLKKALKTMNESAVNELINHRHSKDSCEYIRGFQDAIATIEWLIYEGEGGA